MQPLPKNNPGNKIRFHQGVYSLETISVFRRARFKIAPVAFLSKMKYAITTNTLNILSNLSCLMIILLNAVLIPEKNLSTADLLSQDPLLNLLGLPLFLFFLFLLFSGVETFILLMRGYYHTCASA